jgi:hypothetical protein
MKTRLSPPVVFVLKLLDSGVWKIGWTTSQILSTMSWNLQIQFSGTFRSIVGFLSFSNLDFTSISCLSPEISFTDRVYISSLTPIFLIAINGILYYLRRYRPWARDLLHPTESAWTRRRRHMSNKTPKINVVAHRRESRFAQKRGFHETSAARIKRVTKDHVFFTLLLSYLVLPTVANIQFMALGTCRTNLTSECTHLLFPPPTNPS